MIKELLCKLNIHRLKDGEREFEMGEVYVTKECVWCRNWIGKKKEQEKDK